MGNPDPDQYWPWLRLRLRHGALDDAAAVARHLTLRPTAATAAQLRRFQLCLVEEPDGVLLLAKPRWQALMTDWLCSSDGGQIGLRLMARSGQIWGATALPLDARASQWQLLGRWGQPVETASDGASGVAAASSAPAGANALDVSLMPLVGPTLHLAVPMGAQRLALVDERGQVLFERPLTKLEQDGGELHQPLEGLPEGLLQPRFDQGDLPEAVLRLNPEPQAVGVACLWLSPPEAGAPPLELSWTLPARSSVWHYLLVPSDPQHRLEGLTISGQGCTFLAGDQPETLPDGRTAWRLQGDRPLPLAERSAYRFRLQGQRIDASGQSHPLRLDPLPAAPLGPVWPRSAGPAPSGPTAPGAWEVAAGLGPVPPRTSAPTPSAHQPSTPGDSLISLSEIVVPL